MGQEKKRYIYRPIAPYEKLKAAELDIKAATTLEELRKAVEEHGPRIGYKAFCYIFMRKMTPEAMKPKEAIQLASAFEESGEADKAADIYRKISEWHPEISQDSESRTNSDQTSGELPGWLESLDLL